ncbi:MAG: putative toxin-antitoxin system toxin component, PIN family [Acidobacteriota bacterium]
MSRLRVVLDTNVIVSAVINEPGFEAAILALALAAKIKLYVLPPILSEYEGVLARPKFRFPLAMVDAFRTRIRQPSKLVHPRCTVTASPDPRDNMFLECAEEAGADYLFTGNKKHFPKRWETTDIVNARELYAVIAHNLKP